MDKINIYSTEKNGFEGLSNILNGPITIENITFPTVEHQYQFIKAVLLKREDIADEILNALTGWDVYRISKRLPSDASDAKLDRVALLEKCMRECFEQNEKSRKLLLATGNAILTHKSPKGFYLGIWEVEFPRILTEIRTELQSSLTTVE